MIRLVWQGLRRRGARTALTLVGVAACVLALVTTDGMLGALRAERLDEVARYEDRVWLQSPGSGYLPFRGTLREESVVAALGSPDVIIDESSPLLFLALEPADNPMDEAGVIGLGVWPGRERTYLGETPISVGQATLAGEGDNAVILGSRAAQFYGVSGVDHMVAVVGQHWRVVGILEETGSHRSDNLVVMPLSSAQAAFGLDGWISAALLTAREGREDELTRSLTGEYATMSIYTQEDIHRALLRELELPTRFLGTLSWAALIIAGLVVANIMNIAVQEHTEEVDLLRAIGEENSSILAHIVTEGLILSLGGGLLGVLAAIPTAYALDWAWIITWGEMLRLPALVMAAGLLGSVYPAYRAVRMYPQALRYNELRQKVDELAAEKRTIDRAYGHMVRGREEERERLARELHDIAIQSLVGLKFRLVENAPDTQAKLQPEIDEVIEVLRRLCADLRPPALERLGLAAALKSYVDDFAQRHQQPVSFRVEGEARRLSPDAELAVFRVAQEALANAWKHAQTPRVEMVLSFGREAVELTVTDLGQGFRVPERLGALTDEGHFGLVNMQERMELVGGALRVTAEEGRGTIVSARVPLPLSD